MHTKEKPNRVTRSTALRDKGMITDLTIKWSIDHSHIVLIIAIWPGDRIRRPEHSTVEHGSCDESA